ncbi:hypothetical protein AX14_003219 [Amanita brunnescens Koide BX004]|nr:hypothetical protein AX14_003219 [Amanita brunnescens Koide BX004]
MQRRGKGQLRIASPGQNSQHMGSDPEKLSRLSRRNFGVTNRIWVIVALFIALILLTHYVLPTHNPAFSQPTYSNANLKAKNYLQPDDENAQLLNPFDFCPAHGPADEVGNKYGAVRLGQSRMHVGSGARVQRVLNRALAGYPVTISVIGGSISACHGAGDDPIAPKCYPSRFFQWWNSVFPHPASELTNGAMRRTDSRYFGFCSAHHLPDHTDLIIVELDSDDQPDPTSMEQFEILIRSLLTRPEGPAVILLGHFSQQTYQTHGYAGPDHWHNTVSRFYDVPHLSTKPILLPDYLRDQTSIAKYFADPVLANPAGHEILNDVLVSFFQTQICTAWNVAHGKAFDVVPLLTPGNLPADTGHLFGGVGQRQGVPEPPNDKKAEMEPGLPHDAPPEPKRAIPDHIIHAIRQNGQLRVPQGRINTRPGASDRPFQEIAPFCVSANNLINPLPPSLFYGSGWSAYHPPTFGSPNLHVAGHYWHSTLPTSKLRVPIQVGAGDIGIYYLKEPVSQIGEGSEISCWVDDNVSGAKTIENAANIGEPTPTLEVIDHFVTRGSHYVECQLMGEEGQKVPMFKIMGIFAT